MLVAHANVIRTVLAHILDIPMARYYRLEVPKARVSRVAIDDQRGSLQARLLFHGARL